MTDPFPKVQSWDGATGLRTDFVQLPKIIYADDEQWIPEVTDDLQRQFSAENAWFNHGQAQCFVISKRARLAVFRRERLMIDDEPAAFFGFWESVGDSVADQAIWHEAECWARAAGAKVLYGPINFSTYGAYRLRLSAEKNALTFQSEPYNPQDYPGLLERAGFHLCARYVVQIGSTQRAMRLARAGEPQLRSLESQGYRFVPITPDEWMNRLPELHAMVDHTFSQNFAYTPLPYSTFKATCGRPFVKKICPVTSTLVLDEKDTVVAFSLIYPHFGALAVQGASSPTSVGNLTYNEHFECLPTPRSALVKTLATRPESRRKGVFNAMVTHAMLRGEMMYDWWYGSMIRSDNHSRRYASENHEFERWYGLYRKTI